MKLRRCALEGEAGARGLTVKVEELVKTGSKL